MSSIARWSRFISIKPLTYHRLGFAKGAPFHVLHYESEDIAPQHSKMPSTSVPLQSVRSFAASKKQSKNKKVSTGGSGDSAEDVKDKEYNLLVRCIDAPFRKPPKPTPEEAQRRMALGKEYVSKTFQQHNEREHDLACKLRMKLLAMQMLPRDTMWRKEALTVTMDGDEDGCPPLWRRIPTDYPPIEGYNLDDWIAKE